MLIDALISTLLCMIKNRLFNLFLMLVGFLAFGSLAIAYGMSGQAYALRIAAIFGVLAIAALGVFVALSKRRDR